jgi:hypothetical protein
LKSKNNGGCQAAKERKLKLTEQTNITSATQFKEKSTVEALHSDALIGALELKLRVKRYRLACVPFTEREHTVDRILACVQYVFAQLGALSPHRADADDLENCEHIGSIAERYMAEWAAERNARGAL